jgi:hypothetical protein
MLLSAERKVMACRVRFRQIYVGALVVAAGCGGFDKEEAATQIRARFCDGWPYGCTDSTRVVVEEVRKTNRGRQVDFRVEDGRDRTERLASAYFESDDEAWQFLFFENPFKDRFELEAARVAEESKLFSEHLRELKVAQNWYNSIYGRFAESLEELDNVSYEPPDLPIVMRVSDGQQWKAEISSRIVKCELDVSRQQLPVCEGLSAEDAGMDSGPLARAFGETP